MMRFAIALDDENAYWTTSVSGPSGVTHNYTLDINDATLFPDRSSAYALMATIGLSPAEHTLEGVYEESSYALLEKFM